ncbi:DUF3850 domain-containing protein [Mastigocladus laminosus UU774]|nr:DUF3850 domain-containing protein [Mastigocladus laminosus UU774]
MTRHQINLDTVDYQQIVDYGVDFLVLFNDKNYKVNDVILIHEKRRAKNQVDNYFTGNFAMFRITNIVFSAQGLLPGYIIAQFKSSFSPSVVLQRLAPNLGCTEPVEIWSV